MQLLAANRAGTRPYIKQLCEDCAISQGFIAEALDVSRPLINRIINSGYQPPTHPDIRYKIEKCILDNNRNAVTEWMGIQNITSAQLWLAMTPPLRATDKKTAAKPVNPDEMIIKEVEMLTTESRKHFRLFRDPFPANGGVEKDTDIYLSDDHRFIEAAMLDAAKHSGLIAVIGQVGSGKSTIRKRVFEQLRKDGGILTVFPQIMENEKINSSTLCDAIIMDVSDQRPRVKHEHKARQVRELLIARIRNGDRCCLVIEEAHNLTVKAFITLKRLWEMEDGYNKLLSIIIIGQTELDNKLDERHHPEMREFIRRCQIARIGDLGENLRNYLELKFKRVGSTLETIFDDDAITALGRRLTSKDDRGKLVSHAYPLTVNLYAVRAINLACEMGENRVTAEVVEAL